MEEYRFIKQIGQGTFAQVWLVENKGREQLACKVSEHCKLLQREARYMKELQNPVFPRFVEYRENNGRGQLFMEYIPGTRLTEWVPMHREKLNSLHEENPEKIIVAICAQIAEGLAGLQEREPALVYRDLKPDNILVTDEGRVRIVDLGLLSPVGTPDHRGGSPGFAAPEQFEQGGILTERTDIYALGKVMEWMLGEMGSIEGCGTKKTKTFARILQKCASKEEQNRLPGMRMCYQMMRQPEGLSRNTGKFGFYRGVLDNKINVKKAIIR